MFIPNIDKHKIYESRKAYALFKLKSTKRFFIYHINYDINKILNLKIKDYYFNSIYRNRYFI